MQWKVSLKDGRMLYMVYTEGQAVQAAKRKDVVVVQTASAWPRI